MSTKHVPTVDRLGRMQRYAYLVVAGTMKTTPKTALQTISNLLPLHLVIIGELRMAQFRVEKLPYHTGLGKPKMSKYMGEKSSIMFTGHITPK